MASDASTVKSPAAAPKEPFNPMKFAREVRQEAKRVTWATRKETVAATIMVFVMVVVTALFFMLVDGTLGWTMKSLLALTQPK